MLLGQHQATTEETSGGWEVKGPQRRKTCARAERTWAQLRSQHDSLPTREWCYVKVPPKKVYSTVSHGMYFAVICLSCVLVAKRVFCLFVSAGFRRPVVIFGPISDAVNEKLANDMPNMFVVASKCLHYHLFIEVLKCMENTLCACVV